LGRAAEIRGDESRLAGIGETDQADVGEKFQFEPESEFPARRAGLVLGGGLVPGFGEARVPAAPAAAFGDDKPLLGLGEVEKLLAGIPVVDDGPDGHLHFAVIAVAAGLVRSFPMGAALRLVLRVIAQVEEGVVVEGRHDNDVAAAAAIAAGRAALGDELLAPEGQAAVAAVAGLHVDFYLIDEHGKE